MPALPAARSAIDFSLCPAHGAGILMPMPTGKLVLINKMFAAKGKDLVGCAGGPVDYIITGAKDVLINGQPGARLTSKTLHQAVVMGLSTNVLYGGASGGVTLGNPDEAAKMCENARRGRAGGGLRQSYGQNCGCECARMLLNKVNGTSATEEEYLKCQEKNGNASEEYLKWKKEHPGRKDPPDPDPRGNSDADQRERQLANDPPCAGTGGIPSHQIPQAVQGEGGRREVSPEMQSAVANGQGVIANTTIDTVGNGTQEPGGGNHSVIVSGMTYDGDGKLQSVTVVDTGHGNCAKVVPADKFARSLGKPGDPKATANATDKPVF